MIEVAGHQVRALRVSFVGELGWELHIPNADCVPVYQAVMEAGKDMGIVNAAYRAIDSLSIEKGYPHWHQEVRVDDNPLEAGLLFTCKLKTDTDFLGRTALEQKRTLGVRKKKVCFTVEEDVCLLGLEAIRRDGGKVTPGWLAEGNYEIESRGKLYQATLHTKTPFDPRNERIQGHYTTSEPNNHHRRESKALY